MSSHTTTSLLLPRWTGNFYADVVGADATATTFVLDCDLSKMDKDMCGATKDTVIVGPWADKTPAPGAPTTGLFRLVQTDKEDDWSFSLQCHMSKTDAKTCTTVNINGNNKGTPTRTFTRTDTTADVSSLFYNHYYDEFSWLPVTVTAGHEYLSTTITASAEAITTNDISETAKVAKAIDEGSISFIDEDLVTLTGERKSTKTVDGKLVTITGEADPSKSSDADQDVITITGEAAPSETNSGAPNLRGLSLLAAFGLAAAVILL